MKMSEAQIHDYARQFLEQYGDTAVVMAAQKALNFEQQANNEEAETWRSIEKVLQMMRGPHAS